MLRDDPFLRQVSSPIDDEQLRPLDPRCQGVQFSEPLTGADCVKLARFLEGYPEVPLRACGHLEPSDLAFLRHFPFLRGFYADLYELRDWDGLAHLPDSLESLGLGATRRRFSLKPLARFRQLKDLFLDGHTRDIRVIGEVSQLVYLTLRSVSLPDLSPLRPLVNLRSLALRLGGTRHLAMLPELTQLRYLELWMVRGLNDVSMVAELPELRYLFLQDLKNVTSLPAFRRLGQLRRCHIENLKGLSDVAAIAEAPNLEELLVLNMRQLPVERFACFRGHPTLRAALVALGSLRRNVEVATLLGLPTVTDPKPIRRYVEDRADG